MLHRERPLLLAAGRGEDAAVHVPEPAELGQLDVLVRLERLVVDDPDRRERDAALGADPDRVAGQAVLVDHALAALEDAGRSAGGGARSASGVSTSNRLARAAAIVSGLPLYVPTWLTRPSSTQAITSSVPPIAPDGSPPPSVFASVTMSGHDAEALDRAAGGDGQARLDLVEDEHDPVLAR